MPNHASLASLFGDIADAIRGKTGGSAPIVADDFPTAIAGIPSLRVGTQTITSGSSLVRGISFTDLPAEPVYFFCMGTPSYTGAMSGSTTYRYVTSVWFDGEHVYSHRLSRGSNTAYVYFDTDVVTKSYSDGTLSLNRGSDTNHYFRESIIYTLIYFY